MSWSEAKRQPARNAWPNNRHLPPPIHPPHRHCIAAPNCMAQPNCGCLVPIRRRCNPSDVCDVCVHACVHACVFTCSNVHTWLACRCVGHVLTSCCDQLVVPCMLNDELPTLTYIPCPLHRICANRHAYLHTGMHMCMHLCLRTHTHITG